MSDMQLRNGFPLVAYQEILREAESIIDDRTKKGRNAHSDFWAGFPHGPQDVTFELHRRVKRILGAEKIGDLETMRGDAIDLLNYAAFLILWIDREAALTESQK